MRRFIMSFALATLCACIGIRAQDTTVKSKTETKGGTGRSVTYTGCVETGTETRSYVLDKIVPLSRTTTSDASGTSTVTSYALIPGEKVEIETHVGHKVEVTGMLVPAGEVKSQTKTTVEREHAEDSTSREKTKTKTDMPQFRVTSIKTLAENCS